MKIVLFIANVLFTQTPFLLSQGGYCAFDIRLKELVVENSQLESTLDSFQKLVQSNIEHPKAHPRSLITIPIVVHVVWHKPEDNISDDRILKQIEMLNLVFTNKHDDLILVPNEFKPVIGNPNINFCLAAEDPFGNETSGILRIKTDFENIALTDNLFFEETGGSTAWDPSRFLNVWITGSFGNTGYASFPEDGKPYRDGVVLSSRVVDVGNEDNREGNGRVAVHEIGHYLGLHHIWGDDLYAEDSLCLNDDGFSDTPLQWRYSYRCPTDLYPAPFSCGSNDMYVNFMDYSPDMCLSMFTQQQVEFMRSVLEVSRPGLLNMSIPCLLPNPPVGFTFGLYPNPAENELKLKMSPSTTLYEEIILYDIWGVKLWSNKVFLFDGSEINIPHLPNGVYIIKINDAIQRIAIIQN